MLSGEGSIHRLRRFRAKQPGTKKHKNEKPSGAEDLRRSCMAVHLLDVPLQSFFVANVLNLWNLRNLRINLPSWNQSHLFRDLHCLRPPLRA